MSTRRIGAARCVACRACLKDRKCRPGAQVAQAVQPTLFSFWAAAQEPAAPPEPSQAHVQDIGMPEAPE
eukprot:532912-Alexandrium_andersonii.AAC.1